MRIEKRPEMPGESLAPYVVREADVVIQCDGDVSGWSVTLFFHCQHGSIRLRFTESEVRASGYNVANLARDYCRKRGWDWVASQEQSLKSGATK